MPDRDQDELTRKRKPPRRVVRDAARLQLRRPRGGDAAGELPRFWRAVLVVLSIGGVLASITLSFNGHGILALRLLAGDVILATLILLVI